MRPSRFARIARLLVVLPIALAVGARVLIRAVVALLPARRASSAAPAEQAEPLAHEAVPAATRGVRVARGLLVGIGVAGLLVAAWVTVTEVRPQQYGGVLLWLAAAVVLHDGVLAPIVFGANRLLRGVGARIPAVVLAILQVAVVVGAIFTLAVVPEIRAQQLGARNPTVLPMEYALNLVLLWVVLAVLAIVACALALRVRRRTGSALSTTGGAGV